MPNKIIVAGFVTELMEKAKYGVRGEKPLALIATLKYLHENSITGFRLLELFAEPHIKTIRSIFLDLAREYSPIREPSTSWNVITGKTRELQDAIQQFRVGDVNEAVSKLKLEEIEALLNSYINRLKQL